MNEHFMMNTKSETISENTLVQKFTAVLFSRIALALHVADDLSTIFYLLNFLLCDSFKYRNIYLNVFNRQPKRLRNA